MRHHDAGQPQGIVQGANQAGRRAQRNRVQPGKRLVVHDELRVQGNGPRQGHAPCHAAGNFAGLQRAGPTQANGVQLHQHDVADQCLGQIGMLAQGKRHVVEHIHVGKQRPKLKQHAHAPAHGVQRGRVHLAHVLPIEQHLALLRPVLPANQAQHGGFAAA